MNARMVALTASVCLVVCGGVHAAVVGFETGEGFTAGGPWPPNWSATASGGVAAVSTANPSVGDQGLEVRLGSVNYSPNLAVPAGTPMQISFDVCTSDYSAPENLNVASYGHYYAFRQDYYFAGGVLFRLDDTEDWSATELPKADDFEIRFWNTSASDYEVVGYFTQGTWYRYTMTLDSTAGSVTHRLDGPGGLVAERTYANTVTQVLSMYFFGSDTASGPAYFDQLGMDVVPEPLTLVLFALGGLAMLRRRQVV